MKHAQIILRWIMRIGIAAMLLFMLFLGVLYWFMQRNPAELADKYLAEISERTGLSFSAGSVEVLLLPLPAVGITDLRIKGDKLDFSVAWLLMRPSLLAALRGNFVPARITLLRPRLLADTDLPLADPATCLEKLRPAAGGKALDLPDGLDCALEMAQGEAVINGAAGTKALLKSLNIKGELDSSFRFDGDCQLAALRIEQGDDCLFKLEGFALSGASSLGSFFTDTKNFLATGAIGMPGVAKKVIFHIEFNGSGAAWNSAFSLAGDLDLAGVGVPLALSGRASHISQESRIRFRGVEWQLDADNGRFDGALRLPQADSGASLAGTLIMRRGSLTQWLGFARNLAPGLQLALDNIVNARLRFKLNAKSLVVTDIEAECMGAVFTGTGGVADFAKPVVALDLQSKRANLGYAVPESLGHSPLAPVFPYPPLTPMPGTPLQPGETGIGYDIKLAAEKVVYGPLLLQKASLRIYPGKMDKTGLEDVLLDGKASFYGGSVTGNCILGADKSLPMSITATARQVNGAPLAKAMPILPLRQGRYYGDVKVMSKGKKLAQFLANLRGQVSVSGDNAVLPGFDGSLNRVEAAVALDGASLEGSRVGFDGKWRGLLRDAEWEASGSMGGKLWFGSQGLTFKNLSSEFNFKTVKDFGPLPAGAKIGAKGSARCDGDNFEFNNIKFSGLGVHGSGNLRLGAGNSWKGSLQTEKVEIDKLLTNLGIRGVNLPQALRTGKLAADFSGTEKNLKLSKIRASVGATNITGSLAWQQRNNLPFFDFGLNLDKIDLEQLVGGKNDEAKGGKLDFSYLKKFNASGEATVKELLGFKARATNLRLTLRLNGGKLTLGPNTATFYGANMQSRGTVDFNKGLAFNTIFAIHGFDLGRLAQDQKIEGLLSGLGSLDARLEANLTSKGQMPGALNGEWDFSLRNGSWQALGKNGKPKGDKTKIDKAAASGKIEKGVLRSSNFVMSAPGMKVDGGGWLNLGTRQIECNLNVNMKGLPDFPLRLYGNLGKTKTSIGTGKMMLNAIGGITTGFVDILGGIAEGALKIFR